MAVQAPAHNRNAGAERKRQRSAMPPTAPTACNAYAQRIGAPQSRAIEKRLALLWKPTAPSSMKCRDGAVLSVNAAQASNPQRHTEMPTNSIAEIVAAASARQFR